jgi:hypothetical protein
MVIVVLGHRGMLGRRVMERFPRARTTDIRSTGELYDPLLGWLEGIGPDWVIDCAGATGGEPDLWAVNAILPHRIAHRWRLIQPSTDHVFDDTEYARSKRLGEAGTVIRCAIVDPDGGMLARAAVKDTVGQVWREWNGITARAWADIAGSVIAGNLSGTITPGTPTITHHDLLVLARTIFGWPTRTLTALGPRWAAPVPSLMLAPIEEQLRAYL